MLSWQQLRLWLSRLRDSAWICKAKAKAKLVVLQTRTLGRKLLAAQRACLDVRAKAKAKVLQ
jgi:hypothetical protein